ncbi:helix-turn-helix domain-containing protein [Alishewanella sp. d11]|uniref:helix-turn-helix domain-containing protein n=1 Tax=Alishewanella sp. d11 TaxID=3414030 RepID=UPI003BF7D6D5
MNEHELLPEFGLNTAQLHRSYFQMQEQVSSTMGWRGVYESLDDVKEFYSYSASALVNTVKISSVSNSRIFTKVHSDYSSAIFLPTAGEQSTSIVNGKKIHWGVNNVGLYAPPGERIGYSGNRSVLIMDINHQRLQNILNLMRGKAFDLTERLANPIELTLQHNNIDFVDVFKGLVKQIDLYSFNTKLLEFSGLDDHLYRMAAIWMFPDLLVTDESHKRHHEQTIKRVKDYIFANLHRNITLTELESISFMSGRTLQLLFSKHTQLSPLQWIKEQRLLMAQQRLIKANENDSITEIAANFGFYSAAQFATLYKQRFGISPSQQKSKK